MTKKATRYSEEFKTEAVRAIENNGDNVSATARQLGLPMQPIGNEKLIQTNSKVLSNTIQRSFQPLKKLSV